MEAAKMALKTLGPSHTERAYEDCMVNYFYKKRVPYLRQKPFYEHFEDQVIPVGVCDIEVDHSIVLELKANVKEISEDHKNQLRRYLRAANHGKKPYVGAVILFSKEGQLHIWCSHHTDDQIFGTRC